MPILASPESEFQQFFRVNFCQSPIDISIGYGIIGLGDIGNECHELYLSTKLPRFLSSQLSIQCTSQLLFLLLLQPWLLPLRRLQTRTQPILQSQRLPQSMDLLIGSMVNCQVVLRNVWNAPLPILLAHIGTLVVFVWCQTLADQLQNVLLAHARAKMWSLPVAWLSQHVLLLVFGTLTGLFLLLPVRLWQQPKLLLSYTGCKKRNCLVLKKYTSNTVEITKITPVQKTFMWSLSDLPEINNGFVLHVGKMKRSKKRFIHAKVTCGLAW